MAEKRGRGNKTHPDEDAAEIASSFFGLIITDSFNEAFRPLTLAAPECLMLKAFGICFLELLIDFLRKNGVMEIIVASREHAATIREHLNKFRSRADYRKVVLKFVELDMSCDSVGEALRYIAERNNVVPPNRDFLLAFGDTLAFGDITPHLESHKANKAKDPNVVMTKLVADCPSTTSRLRSQFDDRALVLDANTLELLLLAESGSVSLPHHILEKCLGTSRSLSVRYCFTDPMLYIATPALLNKFTEAFDFHCLDSDFITQTLGNAAVEDTKIYVGILESENHFALSVSSPRLYYEALQSLLSLSFLESKILPSLPPALDSRDGNLVRGSRDRLRMKKTDGLVSDTAVVESEVKLGPNVCILANSRVAGGATIRHSYIGSEVTIGAGAVVEGCVVFDGVSIGEDAVMKDSLIDKAAEISASSVIGSGCLIGSHVIIDENINVPPLTDITLDGEGRCTELRNDPSVVGPRGRGERYKREELEVSERIGYSIMDKTLLPIPKFCPAEEESEAPSGEEEVHGSERSRHTRADFLALLNRQEGFIDDIRSMAFDGLQSSLSNPHVMKHKTMEAKTFRITEHKTDADAVEAFGPLVWTFLVYRLQLSSPVVKWDRLMRQAIQEELSRSGARKFIAAFVDLQDSKPQFALLDTLLAFFLSPIFAVSVPRDQHSEKPSEADMWDAGGRNPMSGPLWFCGFLEVLVDADLCDPGEVTGWHRERSAGCDAEVGSFLQEKRLVEFIKWLTESDSEDSDSEEREND